MAVSEYAPRRTVVYLFYSAAALIIAAAGLLRVMEIVEWSRQAPLLMAIPIAYIVAARLWRGQLEERALGWVARTAAAVILVHGLLSVISLKALFVPMEGRARELEARHRFFGSRHLLRVSCDFQTL